MSRLILLRHGQSQWNRDNLFTGWVDVPLTDVGINEALAAGDQIAEQPLDVVFTSSLMRAQQTALLALSKHHSSKVPIHIPQDEDAAFHAKIYDQAALENSIPLYINSALNERYYGELQGMNKDSARAKFGAEQVHIWRRSFDTPPPGGESLKDTLARTWDYAQEAIIPALQQGKNCLVAAHGNSLRAMIMQIENLSEQEILQYELATGDPKFYEFKPEDNTFVKNSN